MLYCIIKNGQLLHGTFGLAIGDTEQEAWERAFDEPWSSLNIEKLIEYGYKVKRCNISVINLEKGKEILLTLKKGVDKDMNT